MHKEKKWILRDHFVFLYHREERVFRIKTNRLVSKVKNKMLVSLQKKKLIMIWYYRKDTEFSAWNDTKAKETDEFWDITQSSVTSALLFQL